MAQNKKSFLLYADLLHTVSKLPNDKAGELFKLILSYVNDENPDLSSLDLIISIAFEPIRQSLKRDLKKYNNIVERNRSNGSKGGRPKKPTGLIGNPNKPKKADSDNDSDSVNKEVCKYIYNEFYDSELKLSENNIGYENFIKWIFVDNELARPLNGVLKMREQLNFKQYQLLEKRWWKLKEDKKLVVPSIKELLVNIEDWVVQDKKLYNRTVKGSIDTFLNRNTKNKKQW